MSLSQAMSIALSGMRVSTSLITLTSNNIANAETEGYTAKKASVASVSYGTVAGGAAIDSYSRATDSILTTNLKNATTATSYYDTLDGYMGDIQTILDSTADSPALTSAISDFGAAWTEYTSNPESSVEQQNVINAGTTLASTITSISNQLDDLDRQVESDISGSVTSLNTALSKIADLNGQMLDASTSGQATGDIEDQIDAQVRIVAQYTDCVVQTRSNGQIALYTSSGLPLVDSVNASTFTFDGTSIYDRSGADVTDTMNGGSIEAMVNFRDTSSTAASSTTTGVGVIQKLRDQLSTLVDALTGSSGASSAFATAYSTAVTDSTASTGTQNGVSVATSFFTVTNDSSGDPDPNTFAVNSALIAGTSVLPQMSTDDIAASFDSTASYSTSGLTLSSATYSELSTGILSSAQQTANTVSDKYDSASSLKDYYSSKLTNQTGVNMDDELANLVTFQSSYSASAHIISTIKSLYDELLSVLG